ncbi:phosphatidylserine decarboxylase [uncultured Photobacterium sp.]|uniref:phosphatidylserine decarboxylase n=1 Tax=uncultured Photobacterium sp. TaxID=173973 RepID=UPI002627FF4E|nr:phosphatidylserine decarboxylase [uncultured Photobacterium sp.]
MTRDEMLLFEKKPLCPIVEELKDIFENNPEVQIAFNDAIDNIKNFPDDPPLKPKNNIWAGKDYMAFCFYFNNWFHFLATPSQAGLGFIMHFTEFYYNNDQAAHFLNTFKVNDRPVIYDWTVKFIIARGKFMDTPGHEVQDAISEWINDPATHIEDFQVPSGGYKTFNAFFTRELKPGARTVCATEDDSVIVAPADSELNMIDSALTGETTLETKGHNRLNVKQLLNGYYSWDRFIGGTALSCVLLPSDYHHYHAPVTGKLVHYEEAGQVYFGLEEAPSWFHDGNVGASDANFSVFEQFHRAIFIFQTEKFGQVAMVAVGLNTISKIGADMSSINTVNKYKKIDEHNPMKIYKGEQLGHFKYGGSLNILLFEPGVFQGVKVHQGQRIGSLTKPT